MDHYIVWIAIGIFVVACVTVGLLARLISKEKKQRAALENALASAIRENEQTVARLNQIISGLEQHLGAEQAENADRRRLLESVAEVIRGSGGNVNIYAFNAQSGECIWQDAGDEGITKLITGYGEIPLLDAMEDIRLGNERIPFDGRIFSAVRHSCESVLVYMIADITDSSRLPGIEKERNSLAEQLESADILTETMNLPAFVKHQTAEYEAEPSNDRWLLFLQIVPTVISDEIMGDFAEGYTKICAQVLTEEMGVGQVARYSMDSFCASFTAANQIEAEQFVTRVAALVDARRREVWQVDERLLNPGVWQISHYDGSDLDQYIYCMHIRAMVNAQRGRTALQLLNAGEVPRITGYKTAIDEAIDKKQIRFLYQPIANSKDAKVFGYEMIPYFPTLPFQSNEEMLRRARLFGQTHRLEELLCQESLRLFEKAVVNLKMLSSTRILLPTFRGACMVSGDEENFHETNYDLLPNFIVEMTEELPDMMLIASIKRENIGRWGAWSATRFDEDMESNGMKMGVCAPNLVRMSVDLIADPAHAQMMKDLIDRVHEDGFFIMADNIKTHTDVEVAVAAGADYLQGEYVSKATEEPGEISDKCMKKISQIRFGKRGRSA